jgi:hypothetical protein
MSVSLDGYVAPIDGSTHWVAAGRSDDGVSWTVETVSNAGVHLMGATTYAGWAAHRPGASGLLVTRQGYEQFFARARTRAPASAHSTVNRAGRDGF